MNLKFYKYLSSISLILASGNIQAEEYYHPDYLASARSICSLKQIFIEPSVELRVPSIFYADTSECFQKSDLSARLDCATGFIEQKQRRETALRTSMAFALKEQLPSVIGMPITIDRQSPGTGILRLITEIDYTGKAYGEKDRFLVRQELILSEPGVSISGKAGSITLWNWFSTGDSGDRNEISISLDQALRKVITDMHAGVEKFRLICKEKQRTRAEHRGHM